jgi:hypothetical protein
MGGRPTGAIMDISTTPADLARVDLVAMLFCRASAELAAIRSVCVIFIFVPIPEDVLFRDTASALAIASQGACRDH